MQRYERDAIELMPEPDYVLRPKESKRLEVKAYLADFEAYCPSLRLTLAPSRLVLRLVQVNRAEVVQIAWKSVEEEQVV